MLIPNPTTPNSNTTTVDTTTEGCRRSHFCVRTQGVGRRAKYLLFRLSSGVTLLSHLGMTGSYRFGSPIRVARLDSGASQDELTARTQALADVVDGLAQFSNDNFDGALTAFSATSDVPGWDEMAGREVVSILTGNVYLGDRKRVV